MKVLMFGWEFPPHITGGLGTACYGLTKAMSSFDDMDITFVVPKAYGDEDTSVADIKSAEQVEVNMDIITEKQNRIKAQIENIQSQEFSKTNQHEDIHEKTKR